MENCVELYSDNHINLRPLQKPRVASLRRVIDVGLVRFSEVPGKGYGRI